MKLRNRCDLRSASLFPLGRVLLFIAVALFATTSVGCSGGGEESSRPASSPDGVQDELWTCSMHPHVLEREPGTCPICGMDLVLARPQQSANGTVTISPTVVQNMGVRLVSVQRKPLFRHIRTLGEVEVGEDRVSVVNLRLSGWVEQIHADKTGEAIGAGDPLFDIYAPDLVAAQEELLLALRSQGRGSPLARSARRKLELFGVDARDLAAVTESGKVRWAIPIRAPRSGYVLHKNVVEGAHVQAGQDLYTIADLSEVWVQAEVYEFDAPWVELGQPAQMELNFEKGRLVEGKVAYVYPTLDVETRTLRVRLEFPNPDLRLKPGMFATVYIEFRREDDTLVIPTEAILHSGVRELVFVSLGEGRFEPREIVTGLVGDRHMTQVLEGLREGEEVVASGQFLIDSESQLQEAIQKMRVGSSAAADSARESEVVSYVCPMHPDEVSAAPGRCPVCGMDLEPQSGSLLHDGSHVHSGTAPSAPSAEDGRVGGGSR